jgi:aryl-alcohol dehydrogenase-like predicted oxidoreductase
MQYRRLGRSGLQVSELSLGSWVTYHNQVDTAAAREMLAEAMGAGVNFFDNAEAYAGGKSEVVMGEAIKALKWPRLNYIVSTKFFWGLDREGNAANRKDTLNRKYLMQAIDGSLQRMGLDFIDLVYCHRPDPATPIEETVWAMSDMITRGKGAVLGDQRMVRRRHPRGLGHRRSPPPAQAGDGAAAVPPVPPQAGRAGIRPAL